MRQCRKLKAREEVETAERVRQSMAEDLPRKQAMIMLIPCCIFPMARRGGDHLEFRKMVMNHLAERVLFFSLCPEKFLGLEHYLAYVATPAEGGVMS